MQKYAEKYIVTSQIAIICWANAGILSAVLLARRRQMTLAQCHFAHRANLIANCWFDVGPTPVAQQALHMLTLCQPFSFKYRVGPTLARRDFGHPLLLSLVQKYLIFLIHVLGVICYNNFFHKSFWIGIPLASTEQQNQIGTVYQIISILTKK